MENVPIIPEFVQYGVIGICIVIILGWCYTIRLFVQNYQQMFSNIKDFSAAVAELRAEISIITARKQRKNKDDNNDDTI